MFTQTRDFLISGIIISALVVPEKVGETLGKILASAQATVFHSFFGG